MYEHLAPCGRRPNCVCSRADEGERHRVQPFAAANDPVAAFRRLKDLLSGMPRTTVVTTTDDYLHAVCHTRRGFPDDLECQLCGSAGVIHVRSASRFGYYDFGVNRARVEALRRSRRKVTYGPGDGDFSQARDSCEANYFGWVYLSTG